MWCGINFIIKTNKIDRKSISETTLHIANNHSGNNSDGLKHANCKQCVDTQEAFVQSLADDAVSIDGTDYLPVGKTNSYKDYELIYYINDVTIDNEEVLVEYGAAGTATGTYEYGLQRLSVEYVNEAKEYYLYNGTGNVVQTTAQNGSAFLRYTYDPFGNVTSINAPMTVDIDDLNRYTYNGEDYDYNTGLQYLRARYYSTETGNFISQDTYLGKIISPLSQNRYTYCHNSPVMFDDPSGHEIVVVSGGKMEGNEKKTSYEGEFIDTALLELSKLEDTDEKVTWLIAKAGWSEAEIKEIREAAELYIGIDVEIRIYESSDDLIDYINHGGDADEEHGVTDTNRADDQITSFTSYSHGLPDSISYGYNLLSKWDVFWGLENEYSVNTKDIQKIDSTAFASDAVSVFYSCRTANEDIAQTWANSTQTTTYAAYGRTNYSFTRGKNFTPENLEFIKNRCEKFREVFSIWQNKFDKAVKYEDVHNAKQYYGLMEEAYYNYSQASYIYYQSYNAYAYKLLRTYCENKNDNQFYPALTFPSLSIDDETASWKIIYPNK